jgi:hypothetical protein
VLVTVGLVRARWPRRLAVVLLVVAAFAIPFAIVFSQSGSLHGFVWQGRDGAPLVLGVAVAAGILAAGRPVAPRLGRAVGIACVLAVAVAQVAAFTVTLDRYTAGAARGFDFFSSARWQPPLGARSLFIIFSLVAAVGSIAIASLLAAPAADGESCSAAPPTAAPAGDQAAVPAV